MPPWCIRVFNYTTVILLTFSAAPSEAFFGLTSTERSSALSLKEDNSVYKNLEPNVSNINNCGLLRLTKRQKKMCRRGKGMADTLTEAVRLSLYECRFQFKYERWNCTLGRKRLSLLQKGFKETSFLYAISSAGLVHSVSRACSSGQLTHRCTCDQSQTDFKTRQAWKYGGCGDNIKYGLKFARKFLKASENSGKDIRAKVDEHNTATGLKVVKEGVLKKCKCHGVSGSCTVQTCWKQLSPFHQIGNVLKKKYELATRVVMSANSAARHVRLVKKKKHARERAPKPISLVYIEKSPSYCKRTRYSDGTNGRECKKNDGSCASICCGRGYNVKSRLVTRPCHCVVIWCCEVKCKTCTSREEAFLCK